MYGKKTRIPISDEKNEVIKTAPAAASLMILIFGLKLGSISLHIRSIEVLAASKDRTDEAQINTAIHSILEI
jgi:hypothetical protein